MTLVYLDYMASTPLSEKVLQAMLPFMQSHSPMGNPSSHAHALMAQSTVNIDKAAGQVALAIGATPDAIVWTSGATEANNLAIKGAVEFYHRKGKHIITMASEHKAVLEPCRFLERLGYEVSYLSPQPNGLLDVALLKNTLRSDTVLVSVMHVNNETGVIQDIAAISECVKARGALLHVDAAQSVGKIPVDVQTMGVDLMTLSAHKAYGPPGIGALYMAQKPRLHLVPQMHGGQQQGEVRSGTLPLHQVVGMGAAFAVATHRLSEECQRITVLRDQLWAGLQHIGDVHLNGDLAHQVPHCLNVSIKGVHIDALLLALRDFVVSTGSSCNSALSEPSHVLSSMGIDDVTARASLRISFGQYTVLEECELFLDQCASAVKRLRQLSPGVL